MSLLFIRLAWFVIRTIRFPFKNDILMAFLWYFLNNIHNSNMHNMVVYLRMYEGTWYSSGAISDARFPATSRRADLMAMRTTIWRPDVRMSLDENGEVEDTEKSGRGGDEEGDEAEESLTRTYTKGPCEHGVKYRSTCKVCSTCPHGRRRSQCRECGGASICEHGRQRSQCKECGGVSICEHGRERSRCKECGGSQICEYGRVRSTCKECGGSRICEHGRWRYLGARTVEANDCNQTSSHDYEGVPSYLASLVIPSFICNLTFIRTYLSS